MRAENKTWLIILGCVGLFLAGEALTVIIFGYPMSHAMADAPEIAGLLFAFFAGLLLAHFRWPAKARWKKQDGVIADLGDPHGAGLTTLRVHANTLWRIHTGGK